jgi:hypothetical protein
MEEGDLPWKAPLEALTTELFGVGISALHV